jgi:hypothetical protein
VFAGLQIAKAGELGPGKRRWDVAGIGVGG